MCDCGTGYDEEICGGCPVCSSRPRIISYGGKDVEQTLWTIKDDPEQQRAYLGIPELIGQFEDTTRIYSEAQVPAGVSPSSDERNEMGDEKDMPPALFFMGPK